MALERVLLSILQWLGHLLSWTELTHLARKVHELRFYILQTAPLRYYSLLLLQDPDTTGYIEANEINILHRTVLSNNIRQGPVTNWAGIP